MAVKRSDLLDHLRRTRYGPGDSVSARRDAQAIADMLKERHGAEVWGIGSLFEPGRPFRKGSDIDLVVRGVSKDCFFEALAEAQALTDWSLDLIPWEAANDLIREIVQESGVPL